MAGSIDTSKIADEIAAELAGYTQEVADEVKNAVGEEAETLLANTKRDAPVKTGRYRRAMTIKTEHEDNSQKRVIWYVKSPYGRLTSLLEFGHAKRGGGRVRAYPHIAKNEALMKTRLEARIKEAIENGNK